MPENKRTGTSDARNDANSPSVTDTGSTSPTVGQSTNVDTSKNSKNNKSASISSENTGATGRKAQLQKEGVPSNDVAVPPQVVSRDELAKDEYTYENGRLEVNREHPNYIFDNQRNQQAAENTVEVAAGTRNEDGTLNETHPLADTANRKVVNDNGTGETDEEKKNREELAK